MTHETKQCPKCGGTDFGKGMQHGYGVIMPKGKMLGSPVEHLICPVCGLILESYVTKPSRFKDAWF
ncbi:MULTISPECIES: transcription initiation factor TFIIIB [Gracilibacillus]|uniref:transcription initiation factor TFIIIB n=1 Tax=Gracilibacillus TaxID=74385 RepID=UPI000826FF2D|nr:MULTISPECIES: transcription initiation factor TFIIIB [Gracilibacillus]